MEELCISLYYESVLDPITHDPLVEFKPTPKRQVIKEETSKQMRYALESVVANGGGKPAIWKGYKIGGKTGTAQKAENGVYSTSDYILSFLSAAPMMIHRLFYISQQIVLKMMFCMEERSLPYCEILL